MGTDRKGSIVKLNELFANTQPEADSAAVIYPMLSLFIGLEYAAERLLIHTSSRIGNMNEHLLALSFGGYGYTAFDCIFDCIVQQIE
ncbi:hypothetical protein D3C75_762340 [compost metagenome]